jgi:hypothetical protein
MTISATINPVSSPDTVVAFSARKHTLQDAGNLIPTGVLQAAL